MRRELLHDALNLLDRGCGSFTGEEKSRRSTEENR